jgi:hypothetical protein
MEQKRALLSWRISLLFAVIGLGLLAGFALSSIPEADDWIIFYETGQRIWAGAPLYGTPAYFNYYTYAPWLAVVISPLSLMPIRWGWAALCCVSLCITLILARRWQTGLVKSTLVLISPPMAYIILHGQVDALLLAGLLLPREWWLLVGLTKPQVTLGLIFGVGRQRIFRAAALAGLIFLISIVWLGNWPLQLLRQPAAFMYATHNLWLGLWPFQVPAGAALILLGIKRRDERLLVAASPFLAPYAAMSSLIGPWLALASFLKDWEAALVWLAWWGAVLYRYLVA